MAKKIEMMDELKSSKKKAAAMVASKPKVSKPKAAVKTASKPKAKKKAK